jgi:membrane-associated protease RseP (regulator of RpoE activity)
MFVVLLVNFSATIAPFYSPGGVSIGSISSNLPANGSGLQAGDVVTRINGTQVLGLADLQSYMLAVNPGQRVLLQTQRGTFMVKTAADPSNSSHALIGIGGLTEAYNPKLPFLSRNLPQILHEAEVWIQLFLVSVGLVNMLPVPLLDGDRLLEVALDVIGVPRRKEIRKVANAAAFSLIILTFLVAGARFGFLSIFLRS